MKTKLLSSLCTFLLVCATVHAQQPKLSSGGGNSDSSGNSRIAITSNQTGLKFDGVQDYALVPHNNAYDIGFGNFTVEAWVYLDTLQVTYPVLMSTRLPGNEFSGIMIFFADGNLDLQTAGINHSPFNNGDIRDGRCHHVAVVRASTSELDWYVDGILKTTLADADYDITDTGGIIFGNDYASNLNVPINGTIQEVRYWNVARSQAQIQSAMNTQLAGNEPGLIGYWRFNDGTGQTLADLSPTNNPGFLGSTPGVDSNDPTFVPACPINANMNTDQTGLKFDGVQDYALVPHNNAYDIGFGNFTVEAWVYLDTLQVTYPVLMSTRLPGNGFSGIMIFFADGNLDLQTAGINHSPFNNGDIRDGRCHHVAVVRASTSELDWYVDGILKTTLADADYDITDTGGIVFGNDYASNLNVPINGTIQEVRYWNVARSQAQIQSAMNTQLTGNEPGLIGYWRFNDGTGQVLADLSPTNNPGFLGSTPVADSNDPLFVTACPINAPNAVIEETPGQSNDLHIYPNPSNGSFTLSFKEPLHHAIVRIINVVGQEVYKAVAAGNTEQEIQISNFVAGVYFVQVMDNEKQYVQKIIVE